VSLRILKENNPEKYQILCLNCNFAKFRYGVCPHKDKNVGYWKKIIEEENMTKQEEQTIPSVDVDSKC